jgi:hypothetical protein
MFSRPGKLLLILLVPVLIYGALKGVLYYNAKRTIDELITSASNHAEVSYQEIDTDLRGVVKVNGIRVTPLGYEDSIAVAQISVASDDPMFFIRSANWQPGENAPPPRLSFAVTGLDLPLSSDIVNDSLRKSNLDADNPCAHGLKVEPAMLRQMGFTDLQMDMAGHYHLDESARTLEIGIDVDLHDIESMHLLATLSDVDVDTLAAGGAPAVSLGGFSIAMQVSPEFGRQALKVCAAGSERTVQEWSGMLAEQALSDLQRHGITLGSGLRHLVRDFYSQWGEIKLVAAPSHPVGLMSLMFVPPQQLADALALRFTHNERPIIDTSFSWDQPTGGGLAMILGRQPAAVEEQKQATASRIMVQRKYERVAVANIGRFVDHQVQIKPAGQPLRVGRLKGVRDGEAEVEQTLHGGKFTVYVPLRQIESLQALVQRELPPSQ